MNLPACDRYMRWIADSCGLIVLKGASGGSELRVLPDGAGTSHGAGCLQRAIEVSIRERFSMGMEASLEMGDMISWPVGNLRIQIRHGD